MPVAIMAATTVPADAGASLSILPRCSFFCCYATAVLLLLLSR